MNAKLKPHAIETIQQELQSLSLEKILNWCAQNFESTKTGLATSFSLEDQILVHHLATIKNRPKIFSMDTGRHFQETFDCMQKTIERYQVKIEVYFPDRQKVETMVAEHGPNHFYDSWENRRDCCEIRKVEPLQRALQGLDIWITGQRQEHSPARHSLKPFEFDEKNGLYKLNPMWNWSEEKTWEFIKQNQIPYNRLFERGFRSVGCEPCTRSIGNQDDIRSGRWWWENKGQKECGLHR